MKDINSIDLTICIVSWNCIDILRKCLESILKYAEGLKIQIIVVDNASGDNTTGIIRREFPQVELIVNGVNKGFGSANNQAVKKSKGRFILFLNPDVVITKPCFNQMIDYLETNHMVGCVGCRLINRDGSIQHTYYKYFPTPLTEFREGMMVNLLTRLLSPQDQSQHGPVEVAWLVGACMMFRREVLSELNGFDEQYFMYGEDIDLCYRLHKSGYKVCYLRDIEMFHYHGASSGKKAKRYFSTIMQRESVYRFMKTNYDVYNAIIYRLLWIISGLVRLTLIAPAILVSIVLRKHHRKHIFNVFEKYLKVVSWGVGLESWARQQLHE